MSTTLFKKTAEKLLSGAIDLSAATIRVAAVGPGYAPNFSTHEFLTDLGANVLGAPPALANVSVANGALDADDLIYPAIAAGSTVSAFVLYVDTGVAGTSPLLGYLDDGVGVPLLTNGSGIAITWNNTASKIFAIA